MVVDARETNRCHRLPPHAALGTAAALAECDWPNDALGSEACVDGTPAIWGAALGLEDSFYQ
eukprot:12136662-Alexandrium_andersonii.AAC.1